MKSIALVIAILIMVPVYGQKSKKKEDGTEVITYEEGIGYALPRTVIKIQVKAMKIEYTPGPFAIYSNDLLGIKEIKAQASSSWSIEDIQLDFFSEPDPENMFKTSGASASLIQLSSNGCLAGIGSGSNKTPGNQVLAHRHSYLENEGLATQFTYLSDTPLLLPGDSTNRFRPTKMSVEQMAAQAASRIFQCRKAKLEIAAGLLDEFHPDGKSYEESFNELESTEKEYLSLFIGVKKTDYYSYSFDFVPSSKTVEGEVVFRFSEQKGIVEKSDLSGKPVMLDIEKDESMANKQNSLSVTENPYAGDSGIYYRFPGTADIKVMFELKTIATARATIAQFGTVAPVPEYLLDGNYAIEFHPETGAVKNIIPK